MPSYLLTPETLFTMQQNASFDNIRVTARSLGPGSTTNLAVGGSSRSGGLSSSRASPTGDKDSTEVEDSIDMTRAKSEGLFVRRCFEAG